MYKKINDYGIIGNLGSCALVGLDGSIDWCCLPHLDSPSVFCSILDARKGGRFKIAPREDYSSSQYYQKGTNILVTKFSTAKAEVAVTDFMPFFASDEKQDQPVIFRLIEGIKGSASLDIEFTPRFDYARNRTEVSREGSRVIARGKSDSLFLEGDAPWECRDDAAMAVITIQAGKNLPFIMAYGDSGANIPGITEARELTAKGWHEWVHRCEEKKCVFGGPWHDMVVRSALTLKILTHRHTGSMAAAATTSLPEWIGGARNWDYRFTWLRDSSFTVQALHNLGHRKEAEAFLKWAQNTLERHNDPAKIQIMYGLHGETNLKETELEHLEGYKQSKPVRIGNGAAEQRQLDIYGELLDAAFQLTRYGGGIDPVHWPLLRELADYVCRIWREKDAGIWEVRGGNRHFVYSKVMCWVALDRAIRISRRLDFSGNLTLWKKEAEDIREQVLARGFNSKINSFVQSFDSDALDASNLLIPLVGFLPIDDLRVQGTIDATLKHLSDGVLVHRYSADDGLPGREGAFLLCSFWLTDCLVLSGRMAEGEAIFLKLMKYANHLGLFAEEVNPETGELLGNFPQAFTHIGFINSALYLGRSSGKLQMGPPPMGVKEEPEEIL